MRKTKIAGFLVVVFGLTLLLVSERLPLTQAQVDECAIAVIPRVENGNVYYEVIGTGFPAEGQVRVEAVNRSAEQHVILSAHPTGDKISGIFIDKDSDGRFYQVSPGKWRVRAQGGACVVKTRFIVPEKASGGVPVGVWAGNDIALRVTDTVSAINFFCGLGAINQPLVPEADGRFDVRGTYATVKLGWPPSRILSARYTGQINGNTMSLTVTLPDTSVTLGPFALTLGKEPPQLPACR